MENPALFALAVLALLATPGPTNTLLATAGAAVGIRRALPLIVAEGAGYLLAILTLGLAVGPAVAAEPLLGTALRTAVGAYLLLLAIRLWNGRGDPRDVAAVISPRRVFLTTLLNPKAIVFAVGIVPFASPALPAYLVGFLALTAVVALGWIALGSGAGRLAALRGSAALVPRVGAAAVSVFALLLLGAPLLRAL